MNLFRKAFDGLWWLLLLTFMTGFFLGAWAAHG